MTKVIARYTRLATGEWGLRAPSALEEGQEVTVEKRNGSQKIERVGTIVWFGGGAWLATLAPRVEPRRKRLIRTIHETDSSWEAEDHLAFYDEPLAANDIYCDL